MQILCGPYCKAQQSQKRKTEMDGPLCIYCVDLIVNVITMDKCRTMCGKRTYICADHIQQNAQWTLEYMALVVGMNQSTPSRNHFLFNNLG